MAVLRWNKVLSENGHQNFNITNENCPLENSLKESGFHSLGLNSRKYFSPGFSWRVRHLVLENSIDVVTVHCLKDLWLISPALAGLASVKLVGFAHMLPSYDKKDWLHRKVYSRMDAFCVLTHYQKQVIQQYLPVDLSRYYVVPNFLDTEMFNPGHRSQEFRDSYTDSEDDILIGCIGRIEGLKGQWELVQAFSRLALDFSKARLLLVGEEFEKTGHYVKKCQDHIEKMGIGNQVHWLGFRKDVNMIFPSLDFFVLPSYEETFGFVVIEAMASGVTVLGTQAGGVTEILGWGSEGFLFEPKSVDSLEKALRKVLSLPASQLAKVRQKALESISETYEKQKVYEQFLSVIASLF